MHWAFARAGGMPPKRAGLPKRFIQYSRFDKSISIDSLEVGGTGHTTRYGYGPAREMAWRLDLVGFGASVNNANATVEIQYFGCPVQTADIIRAFATEITFKQISNQI
jgi:hypothetical protein